ncbi:MAG: nucleotide sugar dehydrogenase [Deltaproteobacteria bacterium]|jgi:UDPglucose 6-dehydrogenase|nr:nucleotide sugar dehydrogenase [Deltaproteobacteria bacterium]
MTQKFSQADVSIIGLGKLGASMVAGMASKGLKVIGVDVSAQAVMAVNNGLAPVEETDLAATIRSNSQLIRATPDYSDAVMNSSISFVIVPTPSDERGAFSLEYVAKSFESIGNVLKNKDDYHVIVLTSTVLPGSTRYGLLPILEKTSGKKCGPDFGLCYNPEFIALGSVIKNFLNPDFYLLGQFDEHSGDKLAAIHQIVSSNNAPIKRMSLENAEIAKIAVNSYVTLKISFANMLTDICERIPNADVDVVSDAIGTDSRIGRKYLSGGLGFGGPCFPRDNVALAFLGQSLGADTPILEANDSYNRSYSLNTLKRLKGRLPESGRAAVLGLSYKPFSHIVEESAGIYLCQALQNSGYHVSCYDPLALVEAKKTLNKNFTFCPDTESCIKDADIVFVTTSDPVFTALTPSVFVNSSARKVYIVDFWRCLSHNFAKTENIVYIPAGRSYVSKKKESLLSNLWERR